MSVTPERFCKDRYLRASGYNFYVWALVNLLVTWPLFAALESLTASGTSPPAAGRRCSF